MESRSLQRAFRACEPCRRRKVRCNRITEDDRIPLPCARCRRMGLMCSAPAVSQRTTSQNQNSQTTQRLARLSTDLQGGLGNISSGVFAHTPIESPTSPGRRIENGSEHAPKKDDTDHNDTTAMAYDLLGSSTDHLLKEQGAGSEVWRKCWLVRQGWLEEQEASWYSKMFFTNLVPMSPILSQFFADPKKHVFLITKEPILCYAMLTISSQYHPLPGIISALRGWSIHTKAWSVLKLLCERLTWSQEHGTKSKLRTFGTVLALLLLIEWPPRAASLPPDDMADVISYTEEIETSSRDTLHFPTLEDEERHNRFKNASRWFTEVSSPFLHSDRSSGMLLGLAQSLACELNLYDPIQIDFTKPGNGTSDKWLMELKQRYTDRRHRIQLLLFVSSNQLGRTHNMSEILSDSDMRDFAAHKTRSPILELAWLKALSAWGRLVQLTKTFNGTMFKPGSSRTRLVERKQRIECIRHARSLLGSWLADFEAHAFPFPIQELLRIEYHAIQIRLGSLSVEALSQHFIAHTANNSDGDFIERAADTTVDIDYLLQSSDYQEDCAFTLEVMEAGRQLLKCASALGDKGVLKFAPQRVFNRLIAAGTLLLKANCALPRISQTLASLQSINLIVAVLSSLKDDAVPAVTNVMRLLAIHGKQLQELLKRLDNNSRGANSRARISDNTCTSSQGGNVPAEKSPAPFAMNDEVITYLNDGTTLPAAQSSHVLQSNDDLLATLMMPEDWRHFSIEPMDWLSSFTDSGTGNLDNWEAELYNDPEWF